MRKYERALKLSCKRRTNSDALIKVEKRYGENTLIPQSVWPGRAPRAARTTEFIGWLQISPLSNLPIPCNLQAARESKNKVSTMSQFLFYRPENRLAPNDSPHEANGLMIWSTNETPLSTM